MKSFYCFIKRRIRPLMFFIAFFLSHSVANAQCDWFDGTIEQTAGFPNICGPTNVTLTSNFYPYMQNGFAWGQLRWYTQETGGQPFHTSDYYTNQWYASGSVDLLATDGLTVYVTYYDNWNQCEAPRTVYYSYTVPQMPTLNFESNYVCGNVGYVKMTSNVPGISYTLYKNINGNWSFVTSNYTGVFDITDYDPYSLYAVAGWNGGCMTPYYQVWWDTYSNAPPTVSGNFSIYTNTATTIYASSQNDFIGYRWYDAQGNFLAEGPSYTTPPLSARRDYRVRGYYESGCVSTDTWVTILVSQPPVPVNCDDFEINLTQTSTPFAICQPQNVTLTAEFYPVRKNNFAYGQLKWYNQETGGQPFLFQDVYTNVPGYVTRSTEIMANDGVTVWVSFLDQWTNCESPRIPYTFYITPTPPVAVDYAYGCGDVGKLQVTSTMQGVQFSLYKQIPGGGYSFLQSNYSGYFEITAYDHNAMYAVTGWNGGCASPMYHVTFSSFTTAAPNVSGNLSPASGTATTLSPGNGDVYEFKWFDASGNLLYRGYNNYTTPVLTEDVYTYTVQAVTDGDVCVSEPAIVTVTVNLPVITYSPLFNSGNFSRSIDLSKPVGSIPGQAGTNGSGGASYNIPIYTSPGTNKISPSVSVSYNSQAGNGIAGYGWNITGLSAIGRDGKDHFHDGKATAVSFTDQDAFILDGMRLNPLTGANGGNGTIYAGENESYSQITSLGGSVNSPGWFKVVAKNGSIMEYGNSNDSRLLNNDGSNVIMWRLNKIIDLNGNYIEFKYNNGYRDSRIDEINYTGNANVGLLPYNSIKFNYEMRSDPATTFIAGASLNSKHILKGITVKSENTVVKTYQFNYGFDNLYSFLKEVTETGSDGSALNSTIFLYGDNPANLTKEPLAVTSGSTVDIYTGDYNGDGISDIFAATYSYSATGIKYNTEYKIYTRSSQNSGFQYLYNHMLDTTYQIISSKQLPHSKSFISSDFDGDGRDDIMLTRSHIQNIYSGTRRLDELIINFSKDQPANYTATGYPYPFVFDIWGNGTCNLFEGNYIVPGDFDGDGATDWISIMRQDGGSYYSFYSSPKNGIINAQIANNVISAAALSGANQIIPIDFDGDGKMELLVTIGTKTSVLALNTNSDIFSPYRTDVIYETYFINSNCRIFPGDFDGDNKTDILVRNSNSSWYIMYSTGKAFGSQPFSFNQNVDIDNHKIIVSDLNGDGMSDVLHGYNNGDDASKLSVYYSKGNPGAANGFYYEQMDYDRPLGATQLIVADLNGDGRKDFINMNDHADPFDILYIKKNGKERLLAKVNDGLNATTSFNYNTLTDKTTSPVVYNRTVSLDNAPNNHPFNYVQLPVYVLSSITEPNGLNGVNGLNTVIYNYENAVIHRGGRGFLGFKKLIKTDLATNIRSETENEINTDFAVPYTVKQTTFLGNDALSVNSITTSFISLSTGPNDPKRFTQRVDKTLSVNYLTGAAVESLNTYDNYGNVTTAVQKKGTASNAVVNALETETTTTTYGTHNTLVPAVPEQVTVARSRSGAGTQSTVTQLTYTTVGQVLTKTDFYGLPKAVTTTLSYDGFGNVISSMLSATGVSSRIANTNYDSKGRFAISSVKAVGAPIAQTESFTYDGKWGTIITFTTSDCITTSYEYDAFGRKKKEIGPVFTENNSLGWDVSGNNIYYSLTDYSGGKPDEKIWVDVLGRQTKKQVAGFNNQWLTNVTTYDIRGNEATTTNAYYSNETPIVTTKTYDVYNRPDYISNAVSSVQYAYSLLGGDLTVTTTDQDGHASSKTTDAAGKVIASNDKGGNLHFNYDSRGLQTEVRHESTVVITNSYDPYGQKISQVDKNAGTITYDYDALGQLKTETDNSNHTHQIVYDDLGRMISRQGPEGITTYDYYNNGAGCSNNNLKKTTGFNGVDKEYTFDNLMRPVTELVKIDGLDYTTSYEYDSYGNINKLTYPSGVVVKRVYDNNGHLTQVTGGSPNAQTILFNATQKNGFGQYTTYTLGNSRTSQVTYENSMPKHFYTQNIQDLNLTWNYGSKNLLSRQEILKGVTENFQYDGLNRLTQSAVVGQTAMDIAYDDYGTYTRGNIVSKTDAGNYTYRNDKIHAVAYITNPTAINNSTIGQTISYTPFLKTESISEDNHQIAFTYGPEYQRVKSVLQYQNAVAETKIFAGDYEKFTDNTGSKEIHYVQGGNGLCAMIVTQNGTNDIYVTYTDHLGSILTLTDLNGNIVAEQNFDAWGRKRNPQNWTYNSVPTVPTWLYRGFTGHEHLPQFALVNMNGRLYDPIQGRMLSPDIYTGDMCNSQGYNRYSYANNNPLSFVDPDGNFAFLFGLGNLITHIMRNDVRDIGDGLNYFGQGFLAGSVVPTLLLSSISTTTYSLVGATIRGFITWDWSGIENANRIFWGQFYLDENKSWWGGVREGISRFTWERVQSEFGFYYSQFRNAIGWVDHVTFYGGATWAWNFNAGGDRTGATMGSFVNMRINDQNTAIVSEPLYMHEYGHTIQSRRLGILYPYLVLIPSPISAGTSQTVATINNGRNLTTHDRRTYERAANRFAAGYFGKHAGIHWPNFEPPLNRYPR